jgi:hypothetical protein
MSPDRTQAVKKTRRAGPSKPTRSTKTRKFESLGVEFDSAEEAAAFDARQGE